MPGCADIRHATDDRERCFPKASRELKAIDFVLVRFECITGREL